MVIVLNGKIDKENFSVERTREGILFLYMSFETDDDSVKIKDADGRLLYFATVKETDESN